jgi:hypothetical protein
MHHVHQATLLVAQLVTQRVWRETCSGNAEFPTSFCIMEFVADTPESSGSFPATASTVDPNSITHLDLFPLKFHKFTLIDRAIRRKRQ